MPRSHAPAWERNRGTLRRPAAERKFGRLAILSTPERRGIAFPRGSVGTRRKGRSVGTRRKARSVGTRGKGRSVGTRGRLSKTARQAVGYREVLEHLEGRHTLEETVELVKIHSRQLAKRQSTWFRSLSECRFLPLTGQIGVSDIVDRILKSEIHEQEPRERGWTARLFVPLSPGVNAGPSTRCRGQGP